MGINAGDAKRYPVINPNPSFLEIVKAIRPAEWGQTVGVTTLGAAVGYYLGYKYHIPRPSMWMGIHQFSLVSFLYQGTKSYHRLIGFENNDVEVAKYHPPAMGLQRNLVQEAT